MQLVHILEQWKIGSEYCQRFFQEIREPLGTQESHQSL